MAQFESIAPGFPCWLELATADRASAKGFYTSLFGWSVTDFPMGPDDWYSMFSINGRNVGAAYQLSPEMKARGVPNQWAIYFAVESTDGAVARASSLGASVLVAPTDVMDVGRMAVLKDPSGAAFSLWQAGSHKGVGIANEPGALAWTELATRDLTGAGAFYSKLFGWETRDHPILPGGYLICKNAGTDFGGILRMTEEWGDVPPHWSVYWQVSDCNSSAAKIKELGGTICRGPWDIPGVGRLAVCSDPQGAMFYLIQR